MKTLFSLLIFFTISCHLNAFNDNDWGKNGHRTTAKIAEGYLKKRALKKIKNILEGQSLALVSTYADDIKSDPEYRKYSKWHYVNIPEGKTYHEVEADLGENLIWAIEKCINKLKNDQTPLNEKQFYLKMLVHLIGDLHQPLHIGKAEDRGGNDIKVKWFGKDSNLHRVWDSEMIESFDMSYSDLAQNQKQLSKREVKKIQHGTIIDWANDSNALANKVYGSVKQSDKLYYTYMYNWFNETRFQLQKGGIRLAKVLNDIFA